MLAGVPVRLAQGCPCSSSLAASLLHLPAEAAPLQPDPTRPHFGAAAHFHDAGVPSWTGFAWRGQRGRRGHTHSLCLNTPAHLGFQSAWPLFLLSPLLPPASLLGVISPLPVLPPPIALASHQNPVVFSHPVDGFTKASRDTRQRTCSWPRRLVSSSSGPARAPPGTSPYPSGTAIPTPP